MMRNLLKKILYKENNEQKTYKKLTTNSKRLEFTLFDPLAWLRFNTVPGSA